MAYELQQLKGGGVMRQKCMKCGSYADIAPFVVSWKCKCGHSNNGDQVSMLDLDVIQERERFNRQVEAYKASEIRKVKRAPYKRFGKHRELR